MCGIAGQVSAEGCVTPAIVNRMCDRLVHRGPDSSGLYQDRRAVLGARRLAIIDVRAGDQPLFNEDRTVAVVLNGEIYNYRQLRDSLRRNGHRFGSKSDTEVIAHLYEEEGPGLVRRLRGMFAFALWDARRQRLLLARDRVGKKPLYYWPTGDGLVFASELAALLEDPGIPRQVDPAAIDAYLAFLYVPAPLSAIDGVRKLPPASTLVWEPGRLEIERYWELEFGPKEDGSPDEVAERIRAHLEEAVRIRLISERPLGAFLSGGVDSAAVVAAMAKYSDKPIKTFSIGFTDDRFNELPYARKVAERFATDHIEFVVEADAVSVLPKLITHYGDPFADSSAIPSYYVAQLAASEVVVALNGDGGDESFAGYNRYISNSLAARLDGVPLPLRQSLAAVARTTPIPRVINSNPARLRRFAISLALAPDSRYAMRMGYFLPELRAELYEPAFAALLDGGAAEGMIEEAWRSSSATSPLDRMLDVDVNTYLPGDLLVKMDIATMANSLEARSPFLDHVLMGMAAKLPASTKIRGATGKAALKLAMRGVVPDEVLERPKWGFSVPLAKWLRGPLRPYVGDILFDRRTLERGYFRRSTVEQLFRTHNERGRDRSSELWILLVLELWHRRFIDGESEASLL